jgi:hypothetical protein
MDPRAAALRCCESLNGCGDAGVVGGGIAGQGLEWKSNDVETRTVIRGHLLAVLARLAGGKPTLSSQK